MIIFFATAVFLAVIGLRREDGAEREYMSVNMTNSIRGFFLLLVFISHIFGYREFTSPTFDVPYLFMRKLGQCIVTMFLFYSGYGVMESVKKKGQAYVTGIPMQRVLKVLLMFDSAVFLFWLYRFFTDYKYSLTDLLLAFTGWKSLGNSNWYIFSVLWLYVFSYIAFMAFKDNYKKAVIGVFLLSILYMAVLLIVGRPGYCYNTTLCYVWGMAFSLYREKIQCYLNENFQSWLFFLFIAVVGFLSSYFFRNDSLFMYQIWIFCFVASILIFTMRFVVDSKPLQWVGKNLFPLYILQRLPMMFFKDIIVGETNVYVYNWLYVLVCFVATLLFAVIYQNTIAKLIGKLIKKLGK